MRGVKIRGLEEAGDVYGLLCRRVLGVPLILSNDACMKELVRTNRKEKLLEKRKNIG
jgi:hypothetical protein